jgi:hypothetical protein
MRRALLALLLLASPAFGGVLDDFEGGVNWAAAPWSAQLPLWNIDTGEAGVLDTMNAEWKWYSGDQTAGPDYGFISHDTTRGHASSASMKITVTGGNTRSNQPPITYGTGLRGVIVVSSLPQPGGVLSIGSNAWTFQVGARVGAFQIQIGGSKEQCAANIAEALTADMVFAGFRAFVVPLAHGASPRVAVAPCGGMYNCTDALSLPVPVVPSGLAWGTSTLSVPRSGGEYYHTTYPESVASQPGAGGWYVYFGSSGGAMTTGLHDRFVVPASLRPAGSNRMTLWVLNPSAGDNTTVTAGNGFGTRVNSQERFDAGYHAGIHYYHAPKIAKTSYWQKITVTNNPDHKVGAAGDPGYYPTVDNPTTAPQWNGATGWNGYTWNYMEGMQHFYFEYADKTMPPPWSAWIDDVEIWQDSVSNAPEYVATHTVAHLGGGQILLNWTGRWATANGSGPLPGGDDYNVYWSINPLTPANYAAVGTAIAANPVRRVSPLKHAQVIFTIPNFDEGIPYYFAISPVNEPTTAGIVEYQSGPEEVLGADVAPPYVSTGAPVGALASGTTSATISWTTNEAATCKWGTADAAYASLPNGPTASGTSHSDTRGSLSDGGSYTTYVRCEDTAGNANGVSYSWTFSVAQPAGDTSPPDAISDLAAILPTPTGFTATFTAPAGQPSNYDARCVQTGTLSAANWDSAVQLLGETAPKAQGSAEVLSLGGLAPQTAYADCRIRSTDAAGNVSDLSNAVSVTTTAAGVPNSKLLTVGSGQLTIGRPGTLTLGR